MITVVVIIIILILILIFGMIYCIFTSKKKEHSQETINTKSDKTHSQTTKLSDIIMYIAIVIAIISLVILLVRILLYERTQQQLDDYIEQQTNSVDNSNTIIEDNTNTSTSLYSQIYEGMPYYEVCFLLGMPISTTRSNEYCYVCVWNTQEGIIIIQFLNNEVNLKSLH